MKMCKVRPSAIACRVCMDAEDLGYQTPDCSECYWNTTYFELLTIGVGVFGSGYAIVCIDGELVKVSLDRVHDIHEDYDLKIPKMVIPTDFGEGKEMEK